MLLNILLELLGDVLFEAKAATFVFHFESGFTLLESLTKLLFKTGSDTTAELFLPFGQQGFMPFFKPADFQAFHLDKSALHFLFEVGLNLSETLLEGLVVVEAQPFFLDGQSAVVFLVELRFNAGFHLSLSLFKALVLFNTVLFVERLDLPVKSEVKFVTNSGFFSRQGVPLHRFEFGLHCATQFVLERVEGQLVLGGEVLGDVGFHGVHTFGDRLLSESALTAQISPQPFFLTESGACAHRFVKGRGAGGGKLGTQRSERHPFRGIVACVCCIHSLTVMAFAHPHWNPIHLFMDFSS